MASRKLPFTGYYQDSFYGGMSFSERVSDGSNGQLVQQLNIHEDPGYLTLMPNNTKVSGTVITDLPQWMVDANPWATDRYVYGNAGNIYKVNTSNTVTLDRSGATIAHGAAGQGLATFQDFLYYATSTTIGRKGLLDGTPTYSDDFLSDGTINIDQSDVTSYSNTYTLLNAISEAAANKHSLVPTRDPIVEIDVLLTAKGTGNWTLTVHDAYNNLVGSATVNNGSLVSATNYQPFTFATPLRVTLNASYHYHLTSSDGTGTVQSSATNDISTSNYKEFFGILVADANFHPAAILNGLNVGNEHYIATWDGVSYNPNKIVLDSGFKVRAMWKEHEFIVAACWRGANIDTIQDGMLYYWDGIAPNFNYSVPVTEGLPNVGGNFKNRTITVLGSEGDIFLGTSPFQKVESLSITQLARGKKLEVAPGAMTQWQGRTMIGYGLNTDDANFPQGVYGFGNNTDKLPEVITYDFVISTGNNKGTNKKIGLVKAFGTDLYIGWQDGTSYGLDWLNKTTTSVASGQWLSTYLNGGLLTKTSDWLTLVVTFQALVSGESVTPKYATDRSTNFTVGTAQTTVGATRVEQTINKRSREIQVGFNVAASATFPKITSLLLIYNDLPGEIAKS